MKLKREDLTDAQELPCGCVIGTYEPEEAFVIIPHSLHCPIYHYVLQQSREQTKPIVFGETK